MHFEIDTNIRGQYIWRLRANNGEIIAHGESYVNKSDCQKAISLVRSVTFLTPVQDLTVPAAFRR